MAAKNSFVSRLVKDPSRPPETVLMSGYPGDSSEEGHQRLYTDPELSQWVDIPKDAVLHTEEMRGDGGLPGVMMWIGREFADRLRFRTPVHRHIPNTAFAPMCPVPTRAWVGCPPPVTPHPALCLTPSSPACPPLTRFGPACPVTTAGPLCQFTPGGGGMLTLSCPSMVDACPSAPGGCDWFTPHINPQLTPVVGGWAGGFQGGGFQGGGGFGFGR